MNMNNESEFWPLTSGDYSSYHVFSTAEMPHGRARIRTLREVLLPYEYFTAADFNKLNMSIGISAMIILITLASVIILFDLKTLYMHAKLLLNNILMFKSKLNNTIHHIWTGLMGIPCTRKEQCHNFEVRAQICDSWQPFQEGNSLPHSASSGLFNIHYLILPWLLIEKQSFFQPLCNLHCLFPRLLPLHKTLITLIYEMDPLDDTFECSLRNLSWAINILWRANYSNLIMMKCSLSKYIEWYKESQRKEPNGKIPIIYCKLLHVSRDLMRELQTLSISAASMILGLVCFLVLPTIIEYLQGNNGTEDCRRTIQRY